MQTGQSGKIIAVSGGHGLVRRLEAMGIRPGQRISKMSGMFGRGPATIQIGNAQVAIGFGMAKKISVEVESK